MNNNKEITAAFTGHREYENGDNEVLRSEICRLYDGGVRIFLCGMARGFDLAAGECVLSLREQLPGLRLHAIVPFRGQECSFSKHDRERFRRLCAEADQVTTLSEGYHTGAYHQRNDFLVDNASVLVAYYNGSKGGTRYTIHRALKCGLRIINICAIRVGELFNSLK